MKITIKLTEWELFPVYEYNKRRGILAFRWLCIDLSKK